MAQFLYEKQPENNCFLQQMIPSAPQQYLVILGVNNLQCFPSTRASGQTNNNECITLQNTLQPFINNANVTGQYIYGQTFVSNQNMLPQNFSIASLGHTLVNGQIQNIEEQRIANNSAVCEQYSNDQLFINKALMMQSVTQNMQNVSKKNFVNKDTNLSIPCISNRMISINNQNYIIPSASEQIDKSGSFLNSIRKAIRVNNSDKKVDSNCNKLMENCSLKSVPNSDTDIVENCSVGNASGDNVDLNYLNNLVKCIANNPDYLQKLVNYALKINRSNISIDTGKEVICIDDTDDEAETGLVKKEISIEEEHSSFNKQKQEIVDESSTTETFIKDEISFGEKTLQWRIPFFESFVSIENENIKPEPIVKCEPCNRTFTSYSRLNIHNKYRHGKKRQFKCEKCPKMFFSELKRRLHIENNICTRRLPCPLCEKTFRTGEKLRNHTRVHTRTYRYKCDVCTKEFISRHSYHSHRTIHTGEKKYICKFCGKSFRLHGSLTCHIASLHSDKRPFRCKTCNKTFKLDRLLKRHMLIHADWKCHKCKVCGKKFIQSNTLKIHERTHSGERPYKCKVCKKSFVQSYTLTLHLRKHHPSYKVDKFT